MPSDTKSADTPPAEDNQPDTPAQGNILYQQSTFEGINLEGDDCLFGTTMPAGVNMKNINVKGNGRVDGAHMADAARSWRRR